MNIEFINPFTQNTFKASDTGLAEQDQLVFPFKNGVYGLVNDDNMPKASVFQWNRFTKTR
jgi:hypothetical protein